MSGLQNVDVYLNKARGAMIYSRSSNLRQCFELRLTEDSEIIVSYDNG